MLILLGFLVVLIGSIMELRDFYRRKSAKKNFKLILTYILGSVLILLGFLL